MLANMTMEPMLQSPAKAEGDFKALNPVPSSPRYLPGTSIEVLREPKVGGLKRPVLFDFDGTLSLIREGWMGVMVPMMVEALTPLARQGEDPSALEGLVREFVAELTGKQTIYQMERLVVEVEARGGEARPASEYKALYLERLSARISDRLEGLASGAFPPAQFLVPGANEILRMLRDRGAEIRIASGTDEEDVIAEARLLGIAHFATGGIFGARADLVSASKEAVIARMLRESGLGGESLLCFGDGFVEIAACKAVGGLAVAVASDEAGRSGRVDPWKRERLIAAGADLVIPDFREAEALLHWLAKEAGAREGPGAGARGGRG